MLPLLIGGAAALGVGSSIFSGIMGSKGEKARANSIAQWSNQAGRELRDTQGMLYNQAYDWAGMAGGTLDPWIERGTSAADTFMGLLQGGGGGVTAYLQNSPAYKFRQEEGNRALNRQLAARGLYNSGAGLETLARFQAQLEGEESDKIFSRLAGLINVGASASNNKAGIQANLGNALMGGTASLGNMIGQVYANAGAGIGGAQANRYNAIGGIATGVTNALTGGIQNYMMLPFFQSAVNPGSASAKVTKSTYQTPGLEDFSGIFSNPYGAAA